MDVWRLEDDLHGATAEPVYAPPHQTLAMNRNAGTGRAHLFIDADNQSPSLAKPLMRFLANVGLGTAHIFIAGNGSGDRGNGWQSALDEVSLDLPVTTHKAPMRKQSADVRLLFELAPFYHREPDTVAVVLIVSRDDLLLAAAEALHSQGHKVLVAVGAAAPALPLASELPVVVLPQPHPAATQTPQRAFAAAELKPAASGPDLDAQIVKAAITRIRQTLSPSQGGGYAASAVGQVLSQMGYDKTMRTLIVKAIPNLRETGVGSDKRLVF